MKRMLKFSPILAPLALALSTTASANPLGLTGPQDFIIRVGGYYISAGDDEVSFVDDSFRTGDAFRSNVDPGSEWGWYMNLEWKPVEHWGIELGYMDGDNHTSSHADGIFLQDLEDVDYRDVTRFDADISTASLKFYPLDDTCMVQPYIGGGISYTDFGDSGLNRAVRDDLAELGRRGNFEMGSSWGYTWQMGMDFNFGRDSSWLVNVAAVYARSETDMRLQLLEDVQPTSDLNLLIESYSGDYSYDPWMFNLSVGYKFSF
ncbi:outer membrane beta-barrel protein [Microbulbifer bruguierae]|uniref:Outer membrane beta-barrel protein n=1 Tax=Microbulbifer bruguierae TaxID=3029061 RepID=A0ABY8NFQ0_9GAMM|nr:OmpW family outer membrane protein [Microbulbifer bruguierae]WGL17224.1 outer membrane beta-barrel protein [Microbulbifer bruguierae]